MGEEDEDPRLMDDSQAVRTPNDGEDRGTVGLEEGGNTMAVAIEDERSVECEREEREESKHERCVVSGDDKPTRAEKLEKRAEVYPSDGRKAKCIDNERTALDDGPRKLDSWDKVVSRPRIHPRVVDL
jgi:hypothetical protein